MPTGVYDRKNKLTPEQIRERDNEYQKQKRLKNPEKYRELRKRIYQANPEKYRKMAKLWREKNIEKDKENQKRRYWKNPEYYREQAKERAKRNPEGIKNAWLLRHYGITLEHYKSKLKEQNGVCAICLRQDSYFSLAVDHNHKTGKIRGLLCSQCNLALGKFNDNPEILNKAIIYLKNYQ
jgi:hypothetical protein